MDDYTKAAKPNAKIIGGWIADSRKISNGMLGCFA
jgi:hypothetical protein